MALQAVCVPLRRLVIKCAPRIVPSGLVVGLMVGGGLPCLEALRLEVNQRCSAVELAAMPGFVAAFPALTSFEVERQLPWARHPLPVVR